MNCGALQQRLQRVLRPRFWHSSLREPMKALKPTAMLAAVSLVAGAMYLAAQQGPKPDSSETVAKPKKKDASGKDAAKDADLPKIPSKFSTKDKALPEGLPT